MKLTEIVIACFDLEGMLAFYKNVFSISFVEIKILRGEIYEGHIDEVKVTFCSASIAEITAKDNRHQLTFTLVDIRSCIEKIEKFGGIFMNELEKKNDCLQIAIRDVDGNSIILKELL